jgi:hypothetical protein
MTVRRRRPNVGGAGALARLLVSAVALCLWAGIPPAVSLHETSAEPCHPDPEPERSEG